MAGDVAQQDVAKVVAADALFWRRVPADWIVFDDNLGRRRPSSAAFDDDRDGGPMSMYEANAGNTVEDILVGHETYGVVSLTGAQLSEMGFQVFSRPEPGFPAHVEVAGNKTKGLKSKMAKGCVWVKEPA